MSCVAECTNEFNHANTVDPNPTCVRSWTSRPWQISQWLNFSGEEWVRLLVPSRPPYIDFNILNPGEGKDCLGDMVGKH